MKIAVESNDGVTIKSPFIRSKGYLVFNVDESNITGYEYRESDGGEARKIQSNPLLDDCGAIISRGMDRTNLKMLKEKGIDVFITFKTSAQDALKVYLKESLLNTNSIH